MNYAILIYNISKKLEYLDLFRKLGYDFGFCWCVLYYELLFLMRLSDSVYFSVYRKRF